MLEFKNNKIEINELLINESKDFSQKRIPNCFLILLNIIGVSITISRFIWIINFIFYKIYIL